MSLSPGDLVIEQPSAPAGPEGPVIEGRSLTRIAWDRIRRDKVAVVSLGVIILLVL
ncbi:MAG TPA: ABC transporter permease, partial [Acidimicrobiia bacterium]|nr:ABC transporter permease [Acidimicrobiia bacterium]